MGALLEGFLGFFVCMRRALNGEALDASWKRDGTGDAGAGALDSLDDVVGRGVDDPVVIGLEANANALSSHKKNKG